MKPEGLSSEPEQCALAREHPSGSKGRCYEGPAPHLALFYMDGTHAGVSCYRGRLAPKPVCAALLICKVGGEWSLISYGCCED